MLHKYSRDLTFVAASFESTGTLIGSPSKSHLSEDQGSRQPCLDSYTTKSDSQTHLFYLGSEHLDLSLTIREQPQALWRVEDQVDEPFQEVVIVTDFIVAYNRLSQHILWSILQRKIIICKASCRSPPLRNAEPPTLPKKISTKRERK